jgi:guanine deaminase
MDIVTSSARMSVGRFAGSSDGLSCAGKRFSRTDALWAISTIGWSLQCGKGRRVLDRVVRGPLLVPRPGGSVGWYADGALGADAGGVLHFAGDWKMLSAQLPEGVRSRASDGVMLPPLIDIHTHVPQHPIRGRFVEGVPADAPEGRLLAGLRRNVFPAEARCGDRAYTERVARAFLADTLAHGVVGGAAYMTPSVEATEAALSILPETWSVGQVLMDLNCPPDLCTDDKTVEADTERLARQFGRRVIVTDRFAVAVSTALRRRASALAGRLGLRTQTHLNEQVAEKRLVERTLYPDATSYADVYRRDGLLDHHCIAAHCVHMTEPEWAILRDTGTAIAHCPTSNLLLGSGVMNLDEAIDRGIAYALGTDVGASPTVSMLAEMARFLQVHAGRSARATPAEALYRTTLAPAEILGLDHRLGRLEAGRPMSFIEVDAIPEIAPRAPVEEVIRALLPADLDAPAESVRRVTLGGRAAFERGAVRG